MSRRCNAHDNTLAENSVKTLVNEEVTLNDYRTIREASTGS